MKVSCVQKQMESMPGTSRLVVEVFRPGSIGGTPCVDIEAIHNGFDWNNGKVLLITKQPLTTLTPEDVAAIHESVRLGQSWHANEAYRKTAEQRRTAEDELASYKADAERYRFAVAASTNEALSRCLLPLVTAAGVDELRGPMTPESLAELHDNQMKIAIEAGLWPLKAEGETA